MEFVNESTVKILSSVLCPSSCMVIANFFLRTDSALSFTDPCCYSHSDPSHPSSIRGATFVINIFIIKFNLIMWLLFKQLSSYLLLTVNWKQALLFSQHKDNQTLFISCCCIEIDNFFSSLFLFTFFFLHFLLY